MRGYFFQIIISAGDWSMPNEINLGPTRLSPQYQKKKNKSMTENHSEITIDWGVARLYGNASKIKEILIYLMIAKKRCIFFYRQESTLKTI